MNGRLFQVTPDGTIVWEYVVPFVGRSVVKGKPFANELTFRAQAVPYAWVPEGTPHAEVAVKELDVTTYRVPVRSYGERQGSGALRFRGRDFWRVAMDETSEGKQGWLDEWWPLFLIIFGISCVLFLAIFKRFW